MKNDGLCEYKDEDGEKCRLESEVVDKTGKSLCLEHYRYIRDGIKAKRAPKKKRYMKGKQLLINNLQKSTK